MQFFPVLKPYAYMMVLTCDDVASVNPHAFACCDLHGLVRV